MSGRVIVVTGAASGIGRHLADTLVAAGERVVATDVDADGLDAFARAAGWDAQRVVTRALDVRDAEAWEAALDEATGRWGHVDVLLNVAGYLKPARTHEAALSDVDLHLDVNLKGTILGTRAAARRMVPRRQGHIINIGSLASLAPVPGLGLYAASKFGVRGFSLAAAQELREHGVAVSLVLPDAVQTPMLRLQEDYEEAALTFSGPRALTVHELGRLITGHVMARRPLEVTLPGSRGTLARLAGLVPEVGRLLAPVLQRRGRAMQARRRKGRPVSK